MNQRIRISGGLYAATLTCYLHTVPLLFVHAPVIEKARWGAWLSVLLSGVVSSLVGLLIGWICLQFKQQSAVQAARSALGRFAGGIVGLVYALYPVWVASLVLRDVQEFATLILLPGTPGLFATLVLALVVLYAVWNGVEPIVRLAFPSLVLTVGACLILPVVLVREFSLLQVEPIFLRGYLPIFEASVSTAPFFGEIVMIFTLVPLLSRPKEVYRWTAAGAMGTALILAEVVLITLLVLGPILPTRLLFPSYDVLQQISLAEIIERIEMFFVIIWLSTMFLKLALYVYAASEAATDALGLKSHRLPAVVVLALAVALTRTWPGVIPLVAEAGTPEHLVTHTSWQGTILLLFLIAALVLRARAKRRVAAHG